MTYRYLGQIRQPDGATQIFLTDGAPGGTSIAVKPGLTLPDGYVVKSLTARRVDLAYPPLGTHAVIAIPVQSDDAP